MTNYYAEAWERFKTEVGETLVEDTDGDAFAAGWLAHARLMRELGREGL